MATQKPTDSWITGQEYQADGAADQKAQNDALKRARAELHAKNKTAKKTRLQIPLDIRISALDVIKLDATWGPEFAGNWIVDDHTLKVGGAGISSLNLHKCLGYPAQSGNTSNQSPPAATTSTKPAQTVAVGASGSPTPLNIQLGTTPTFVNPATGNIEPLQPNPGPGAGGGQSVTPPGGD